MDKDLEAQLAAYKKKKQYESSKRYREKNKEIIRERKRAYYLAHREEQIAKATAWNKAHPEKVRESSRKYVKTHPEKVKESRHRRYVKNKEKYVAYATEWAKEHPESRRETYRKYRETHRDEYIARYTAYNARKKAEREKDVDDGNSDD